MRSDLDPLEIRALEDRCIQECAPACTAACPMHVDARGVAAAAARGDFRKAFDLFAAAIPFPVIISTLCEQPCREVCRRGEAGAPIAMRRLERVAVTLGSHEQPGRRRRSQNGRIAVVGGGLSGMTAALLLARRGYAVRLLEAEENLGGRILRDADVDLDAAAFSRECGLVSQSGVDVTTGCRVGADADLADLLEESDGVYLAHGDPDGQGLERGPGIDPITLRLPQSNLFAGGSLRRPRGTWSPIVDMADGRRAAISLERMLTAVSLTAGREQEGPYRSRLFTSLKDVAHRDEVKPSTGDIYVGQQAIDEAERCLQCECLECVKACAYLAHYGSYPKKYIREIGNNLVVTPGMGYRTSKELINACSLCGLCREVCPEDVDMAEVCASARTNLNEKGYMPPAIHDFPIRDMLFSNSPRCVLTRHQPGMRSSTWAFLPGCQLSASLPFEVRSVYEHLSAELSGGVGLVLGCCGAPAEWAGRPDVAQESLGRLRHEWSSLGEPVLIAACPSCRRLLVDRAPDIPNESLWTVLDRLPLPGAQPTERAGVSSLALHDACASRHDEATHAAVRSLIGKIAIEMEELPWNRNAAPCCGYGGLQGHISAQVQREIVVRRTAESDLDYLVYCAMCRESFLAQGKTTFHLLECLFPDRDGSATAPRRALGISERQQRREWLKRSMQQDVWGERIMDEQSRRRPRIHIDENVRQKLEDELILAEDVEAILDHVQRTGSHLYDPDTGHSIAHHRPHLVTYWIEYSAAPDGYVIHNAYTHRIELIEAEDPGTPQREA